MSRLGFPRVRGSFFSRIQRSQTGSAVVDYLLVTAAVAGIAVPVVLHYFGEPMIALLNNQRGGLVSFIAQDKPRKKLPPEWFRVERQAEPQENSKIAQQNVTVPNGPSVPNPSGPPSLPNPATVTVPSVGNPPNVTVPGQGGPGGGGASGGGAGGSGGGGTGSAANRGGGGSSSDLDNGFFGGGGGGGGAKSGADESAAGGRTYGRAAGGVSEESQGSSGGGESAKKAEDKKGDSKGQGEKSESAAKKGQLEELQRAQEELNARDHAFDWWLLIKILIAIAILFLLVVIMLGNARKG